MGYSHYWCHTDRPAPSDAYGKLCIDARKILEVAQDRGLIELADWHGGELVTIGDAITEGSIGFNDIGDHAYESFVFYPVPEDFQSCKTAMHRYDTVICAILIRAKAHYGAGIRVWSDGEWDNEWKVAAELCTELFGEAVNPIKRMQ